MHSILGIEVHPYQVLLRYISVAESTWKAQKSLNGIRCLFLQTLKCNL